jgi:hypothetical protein
MIRLSIHGPLKSAKRAAARHGVKLKGCKTHRTQTGSHVYCDAPCGQNRQVVAWMTEKAHAKRGRGFPPGTLTYHTQLCGLGGASKKRGRR